MVTQHTDKLTHEEAFELLPWHVNSTLESSLSEKVEEHLQHCAGCQEESVLLTNVVLALNADESAHADVDARCRDLIGRIRHYDRQRKHDREFSRSRFAESILRWFGQSTPRRQWAAAFALGLAFVAFGAGAIFGTSKPGSVETDGATYDVYSEDDAPLRLLIEFGDPPGAGTLAALRREIGPLAVWREQTPALYSVELGNDVTVGTVADIRNRLLSNESVLTVQIEASENEGTNQIEDQ